MTVRFFMMQTHYRSTLDFSNEALQAAEKGFKRLWEAYEILQKFSFGDNAPAADAALETSCIKLLTEMDDFMNDDFNTAKVLANMFELVPVINSLKEGLIKTDALSSKTIQMLQTRFKNYLENIMGLKSEIQQDDGKLNGVLQLLIDIRRDARSKKDYATSDTIRNKLIGLGILLKDEKDGGVSISFE
jgi:cysteinyl-tRNA synthetase